MSHYHARRHSRCIIQYGRTPSIPDTVEAFRSARLAPEDEPRLRYILEAASGCPPINTLLHPAQHCSSFA